MQHQNKAKSFDSSAIVATANGEKINLDQAVVATLQVIHGANAAAATFTAAITDIITQVAHGYVTGLKVQLTTTTTLPAGLSLSTDYFVIYLTADTYSLASSYNNAVAGTAIDITDTGTGVHTATPSTKAGSLQVKVSNVDLPSVSLTSTDWVSKGSAISISGAAASVVTEFDQKELAYKWLAILYTHTGGQFLLQTIYNQKG